MRRGLFPVIGRAEGPRGVLDQILDGNVPSRFEKHTRSLYQFSKMNSRLYTNFSKYISDFISIFRKCIPDPIPIVKIAKSDTVRYIKFVKIDTVPYAKIMKIDTLLDGTSPYPRCVWYSPLPGRKVLLALML